MKNWFKKKSKEEKTNNKQVISDDIVKWHNEAEDKRACFAVLLDDEDGTITGVLFGRHDNVVSALVNEMMQVEDVRDLILEVVHEYSELVKPQVEEVEQKPKRRRKKTEKVVS